MDGVRVLRDAAFARTGFAGDEAGPTLSFAAAPRYLRMAAANPAVAAVVTTPELAAEAPARLGVATHPDPEIAFYRAHNALARDHGMGGEIEGGIDPAAEIHPAAIVSPRARIGPGAVVAAGAIVHDHVTLEAGALVAEGAQAGCEGHFYKRRPGLLLKVEHAGGLVVEEGAQILAGALVQRDVHPGVMRIGARAVIGPGVSVGHGVHVGEEATIAGGAVLAGFSRIGARAWIGPGAVISNLIEVGEGARVEIGAVIGRSVPPGQRMSGFYARPHVTALRMAAALEREHG